MRTLFFALAATIVMGTAALAASNEQPPNGPAPNGQASSVQVTDAWARASAGAQTTGAAYISLKGGEQTDKLTAVSTPVANTAEVHESTSNGGIMRMRAIPGGLDIPAGKTVKLSPGGYHIMMFGLHHPLKASETFPLTLTFAHSAPITVTVTVRPIGAAASEDHTMGGMKMSPAGMNQGAMGGMQMDHGQMGHTQTDKAQ
ncbi:MAG TPA: copper chaperone PCu(A)C [Rhodopila sp.]|jgi:copper(I)-binding protein|nr:copper chaperone PCu(A)C [Rhodopila sp.]